MRETGFGFVNKSLAAFSESQKTQTTGPNQISSIIMRETGFEPA